jgi:hypothetical protein
VADVIIVSGAIANKYRSGGEAWVRLSWAAGLRRLGFDVYLVEQIAPSACVDADDRPAPFEISANRAYFRETTTQFEFAQRSALICAARAGDAPLSDGLTWDDLLEVARSAALLVNISGHLTHPALVERLRCKAYIDIDPGFTQFWHADPSTAFRVPDHDFYFTIGESIGSPGCPIPTGGLDWRPVRQPVVLDDWPVTRAADDRRFTTVASWRGAFGPVYAGGRSYGVKVHEFRKVMALPERVRQSHVPAPTFEIALDIHPGDSKDLAALREQGWRVTDPRVVAGDPQAFRRYVQESGAEFSVAQGIYVDTNSGWFSDRTVRYLASGKPALVQDTGFGKHLPVGEGVVAFRTLDQAVAGAASILHDYDRHCRAAREVAETYFGSDKVLSELLGTIGIVPPRGEGNA